MTPQIIQKSKAVELQERVFEIITEFKEAYEGEEVYEATLEKLTGASKYLNDISLKEIKGELLTNN